MSGASQPSNKGRARACTSCRQVKLRCDAREKAPNPCTRCEHQGLECKMDPHFKRVPARRALEDVANRLNHLQTALGLDPSARSASLKDYIGVSRRPNLGQLPFPGTSYQFSNSAGSDGSSPLQENPPTLIPRRFYAIEDETEIGTWELGGIAFDAAEIRILFKHFDETHYKHGPFLEPCTSLVDYYNNSELLFWTITMIGCFVFNEYDEFYWKLLPHHRTLLSSKMMGNRVTLSTVHAMLCMATWTYPVSTEYDDLTWMLCGAAIHTAMIMGLHKPGHGHEYSISQYREPGSQYMRNVTWLSIFIISTGISSWLGMPPPLGAASHLETISIICKDTTIPKWYRARADIHRQTVQLVNSINSRSDFNMRHSLIRVYESELDRVKDTYEDVWNDDLEIEWEGARLYMYGIAFVQPTPTSMMNTPETTLAAREILLKGLAAAVGCLDTVMRMKLPPTLPGENRCGVQDHVYQLGFYPKHFFRIGAFANYYLLWFLNVDTEASAQDRDVAKTYITATYQLLTSFTHSFEHYRAGQAIQLLANMPMDMKVPASSQVHSRLGAGIMYSFAMSAEAREPGITATKTLGIDTVGPDGPAHPKVVEHDPNIAARSATANQTQHNPHVQDVYSPHDTTSPQDLRHVNLMQHVPGSTPTSTHSAPEPLRSVPPYQQPTSAGQGAAAMMSTMSPVHAMEMMAQMGQLPPGSIGPAAETNQAFMNNQMFDPAMLAAMPSANWEYPWGEWDASVLQQNPPGDPSGTARYMRNMDL